LVSLPEKLREPRLELQPELRRRIFAIERNFTSVRRIAELMIGET